MDATPGNRCDERIERRRKAMRRELIEALQVHHERRRMRRRMVPGLMLFLVATLAIVIASPILRSDRDPVASMDRKGASTPPVPSLDAPGAGSVDVRIVSTRPSAAEKYIVSPPAMVEWIDDQQLLRDLAALNRPAGLIRRDGRAWLTESVTDPIDLTDR